jgi:ATP-dependent DNA helicase RecG
MTAAQKRSLWEVLQDFEKSTPMNRLLQGDVGSGKTVVAGAAAYQASLTCFQTALLAPTEILATQHAETLSKLLSPFGIKIALLTGSVKKTAREELLKQIQNGDAQIIVGTHALLQPTVKFHKLGFVVIDEQHRFGVKQRQELLVKSDNMPHLLSMTATPIPRSLQLTLFGDLDISILNQLPKGRKAIKTEIISPNSREPMNQKISAELENGRQAYFIAPLVEESKISESESVEKLAKKLHTQFKNWRIGILHGKMPAEHKEKVMREFAAHELDILVATTVVEVGVDVPNSTIIVIENADRFGLAQLHQLRGRVGRGEYQSYCFLVQSDSSAPTRRLREIERSNDGFRLAEVDLQLRGAGEIYGTSQHGQLNLQIASLTDTKMIQSASQSAEKFARKIAENPEILSKYPELASEVNKYQRLTTLN